MSNIVKFFVAAPSDATDALTHGPGASLRSIVFGNFDAEEALLNWEAHLTGSTFDDLLDRDIPEVFAEEEDGATVFLLSDGLLAELAGSPSSRIGETANWWAAKTAEDGFPIDAFVALRILEDLVRLIREERPSGESVYCWTA
ncbi:hypothetical protein ACGFZJ_27265 [Streptomyces sp. NPDC048253]|uniref:hypothetical protein n=1 Tax=Streptomyces sp. NPDC048253 TaxID=3365524 RepID=UPI0037217C99